MAKILNIDGITLFYEKNKLNKGTYCAFGIKTGAMAEKIYGTAHFMEHMLFYKTKNRTKEEVKKQQDRLNINAFTGFNCVCITFSVGSRLVEESFDVCSDMFFNCAFNDDDIEKERGPIIQEIIKAQDNKHRQARLSHFSKILQQKRMECMPSGTIESVKKLREKDLREFQKENYCRENFMISVCTNLSVEKIVELVKKYLIPHLKSNKKFVANRTQDSQILSEGFLKISKNEKDDCLLLLTIHTSKNDYKNFILRSCAAGVLFYHKGILQDVLREKHGLTYSAPSQATHCTKDGVVKVMVISCSKQNIRKVLELSAQVFKNVRESGISVEEFKNWREVDQNEFEVSLQHPNDIVDSMIDMYQNFGFFKTPTQIFNDKMKVTREQVNKFIKKYINVPDIQLTVSGNVEKEFIPTKKELLKMFVEEQN